MSIDSQSNGNERPLMTPEDAGYGEYLQYGIEIEGLLTAISKQPEDDTPRLIFADWLTEKGDKRGDFIREQCQWAAFSRGKINEIPEYRQAIAIKVMRAEVPPIVSELCRRSACIGRNNEQQVWEFRRGFPECLGIEISPGRFAREFSWYKLDIDTARMGYRESLMTVLRAIPLRFIKFESSTIGMVAHNNVPRLEVLRMCREEAERLGITMVDFEEQMERIEQYRVNS